MSEQSRDRVAYLHVNMPLVHHRVKMNQSHISFAGTEISLVRLQKNAEKAGTLIFRYHKDVYFVPLVSQIKTITLTYQNYLKGNYTIIEDFCGSQLTCLLIFVY